MTASVTASVLYNLVSCPHRVSMDALADPETRDPPNAFVQMLWERGSVFETEVVENLDLDYLDLTGVPDEERETLTSKAMKEGRDLIYGGRISAENLVGIPDLLRREDGGYVAGDIKSGAGEEGPEDLSKPKAHYAVQLGLYTDILERNGQSAGRRAFIWDSRGAEVIYDFEAVHGQRNPRTLWQDYVEYLNEAQGILSEGKETLPAYSASCKLCHWHTTCLKRLSETDDLTLIPELGRAKRDSMIQEIPTVRALAQSDPQTFIKGKKTSFPGIGPDTLLKFHERAVLKCAKNPQPVLHFPIQFPDSETELFFDIEVDPMRDICYLHGFVERHNRDNASEKFVSFLAEEPTEEKEKEAFKDAIEYLRSHRPCAIYYYSKYERTIYRRLQEKYPDVCSADEIEDVFDPTDTIDLYSDVVKRSTEWPTNDFSIKTLAKFLGFNWRDTQPSGAASIEWFDRWVKTQDVNIRQRILDYNEDDCRAMRVLLDGIKALEPSKIEG